MVLFFLFHSIRKPFHIRFSGPVVLQYADDVARMFIECARSGYQGAAACNLRNDVLDVSDFIARVRAGYPEAQLTSADDAPLPFPYDLDDSGLQRILGKVPHTPLGEAIDETVSMFRQLVERGQIDLTQLEN